MRLIFALMITLVALACSSGPDIPTQNDIRHRYVGVMSETGSILRQCVPHDAWHTSEPTEAERQRALADLAIVRQLGQAAVDLGVEVKEYSSGDYFVTFEEEMRDDVWHALWPEVEAFQEVLDRNLADLRDKASEAGRL